MRKTIQNIFIEYKANGTGSFDVVKKTFFTEYYNPPEEQVLFKNINDEVKADLLAEICRFLRREHLSEVNTWEDAKSFLKVVTIDELKFKYCYETLGQGWAMHNAYKLTTDFFIKTWLAKCACHNGLSFDMFDANIKTQDVVNSLSEAIKACINMYYPMCD